MLLGKGGFFGKSVDQELKKGLNCSFGKNHIFLQNRQILVAKWGDIPASDEKRDYFSEKTWVEMKKREDEMKK